MRVTQPRYRFRAGHGGRTAEAKARRREARQLRIAVPPTPERRYHLTPQHKAWRALVFERDDYTCQDCGRRRSPGDRVLLEAHHLKARVEFPELSLDVDNGVTLCRECHQGGRHGKTLKAVAA